MSSNRSNKTSEVRSLKPDTISINKNIVRQWNERIWQKDQKAYTDLLSDNCIFHSLGGVNEIRETVGHILEAFPDARLTISDQIAEGDKVVTRWRIQGSHQGTLWGVVATGNPINYSGISINRLENGKIVEEWCELDLLTIMTQIGACTPH